MAIPLRRDNINEFIADGITLEAIPLRRDNILNSSIVKIPNQINTLTHNALLSQKL